MWVYVAVLLLGFWLGVAILLYVACHWLDEILDLPPSDGGGEGSSQAQGAGAGAGASDAHVRLARLVARAVREAAALPKLAHHAAHTQTTQPRHCHTYEDLLATAILNKVIERYQIEPGSGGSRGSRGSAGSGGRSSGIHSASASPSPSERSLTSHLRDITPPLHEEDEDVSDWEGEGETTDEALDVPRRVPFPEFGGDIVHPTDNEDRDFDEVSGGDIQAVDGSWEENWLFQKKKIKSIQSVPVPMLVPNSSAEYRALIGDRDADDTTDLSDNASDVEDDQNYKSDIKRVLDSKHVIGGKSKTNDIMDFEPDSLTLVDCAEDFQKIDTDQYNSIIDAVNKEINDSDTVGNKTLYNNVPDIGANGKESVLVLGVDSGPVPKAEFALKEEIHRTALNPKDENSDHLEAKPNGDVNYSMDSYIENKMSKFNCLSGHEREGEYEETVSLPVQRHADSLRRKHFDDLIPTRDTDKDDLIPGSIAYRERKKWLNYVEMPNNPYSPEAIQKRLSARSTSSLFDSLTTKSKIDDNISKSTEDMVDAGRHESSETHQEEKKHQVNLNVTVNGDRSKSPSPKILKDVLADEVPQYKRYGRDYYIKEAKTSSGGRKRSNASDTSSPLSLNKSPSLENVDRELSSPVSASSSLSELEACALHQNIARTLLSPRHASPNFAINPIYENPDRHTDTADENHATNEPTAKRNANGLLIKQFNTIATNRQYMQFADNEQTISTPNHRRDELLIEYEDASEDALFAAKPVYVDEEDTDRRFEEILQAADDPHLLPLCLQTNPDLETPEENATSTASYISSSSLEDSIKIYNVPSGEIVSSKPGDKLSVRYEANKSDYISGKAGAALSVNGDIHDILARLPKVKELAKKFVSMENVTEPPKISTERVGRWRRGSQEDAAPAQRYMHSLTARSISKQFRDELKLSMPAPLTRPGAGTASPQLSPRPSPPPSPLPPPGTIKTKLAFFESLKSKFSSPKQTNSVNSNDSPKRGPPATRQT